MTNNSQTRNEYETIDTLFRRNLWANMCLFAVCAGLSDEQSNSSITGTYGSIRDTLQHITIAEHSYLHRITTGRPFRRPEGAPPLTMAEMQDSIRLSGEGFIVAAPQIQARDSVEIDWDGMLRIVPSAIILTQAINHATEHRVQIMAMLTQLGIEPPDIDSWSYFAKHDK
jgi:uncharacterized damage-inducible protein DinB